MQRSRRIPPILVGFIALLAVAAGTGLALAAPSLMSAVESDLPELALLALVSLALQLVSLNVEGKASMGVSAVGIVASAAILGTAPAMAIGIGLAVVQWWRRRGRVYKAVFDIGNFGLAAGAAGGIYDLLVPTEPAAAAVLAGSTVAGAAYSVVNIGLLCVAMSLSELRSPVEIWRERFAWAWFTSLVFGPLAGVAAVNYQHSRLGGAVSLLLLPLLLWLGMRRQLEHALRRPHSHAAASTRP